MMIKINKNMKIFLITLIVCLLLLPLQIGNSTVEGSQSIRRSHVTIQENLAPNPSFEEGTETPLGWDHSDERGVIFTWDTNYAHSGEKSIGITNVSENSWPKWSTAELIPVDLSTYIYEYGVWYRYIGEPMPEENGMVFLSFYDVNKTPLFGGGYDLPVSSNWNYFSWNTSVWIDRTDVHYAQLEFTQFSYQSLFNPQLDIRIDDVFFGPIAPVIIIEDISGGLGVSATLRNNGVEDAYDIQWSIDVQGTVFFQRNTEGLVAHLPAGSEVTIDSGIILGFGPATIIVKAALAERRETCFLLGPFVFEMT